MDAIQQNDTIAFIMKLAMGEEADMGSRMISVMEELNGYVDTRLRSRERERIKRGISTPLEGEFAVRDYAESLADTLTAIAKRQNNFGKLMLAGMWIMRRERLYYFLDESESVTQWADRNINPNDVDIYYVKSLAKIADTILDWTYKRELTEAPIMNPKTRLPLYEDEGENYKSTVEMLITKPGMVSKLKMSTDYFTRIDEGRKEELIVAIATEDRNNVSATRRRQEGKAIAESSPSIGKISALAKYNPERETYRIEAEVNEDQLELIRRVLGDDLLDLIID